MNDRNQSTYYIYWMPLCDWNVPHEIGAPQRSITIPIISPTYRLFLSIGLPNTLAFEQFLTFKYIFRIVFDQHIHLYTIWALIYDVNRINSFSRI